MSDTLDDYDHLGGFDGEDLRHYEGYRIAMKTNPKIMALVCNDGKYPYHDEYGHSLAHKAKPSRLQTETHNPYYCSKRHEDLTDVANPDWPGFF